MERPLSQRNVEWLMVVVGYGLVSAEGEACGSHGCCLRELSS